MSVTSGSAQVSRSSSRGIVLNWTQTSSGNTSIISWSAEVVKGTYNYELMRDCIFTATCSVGTITSTSVGTLSNGSLTVTLINNKNPYDVRYDSMDNSSGTFTITHDSSANATFSIYMSAFIYQSTVTNDDAYPQNWQLPQLYGACIAPASISTAPTIIAPSGTFTVTWSGADGGVNNTITGYRIYYLVSQNGAAPTTSTTTYKDVTSTSKSGSTTITLSSAERAYKVVCGIVTMGSAGSSYYSSIKTGGLVTINSLPSAPTPSITSVKIASSSTGQSVTVTPGQDNVDTSQTIRVDYATSPTESKSTYNSALNINPTEGESITYYFWSFDGVEYSSDYSTCTVEKNTKPVINTFTYNVAPDQLTAFEQSGASGDYFLGFVNKIVPKINCSKVGTLYWTVDFEPSTDITTNFKISRSVTGDSFQVSTINTDIVMNLIDIDLMSKYIYSTLTTQYKYYRWRIKCRLYDGIEHSDYKYLPAAEQDEVKYYALPGMSTVRHKYNQFNSGDISNTKAGNMYKEVRFELYKDTSITSYSITSKVGNTVIGNSFTSTIIGDYIYLDVTLNTAPGSGNTVSFIINGTNSSGVIKTVSSSMIECLYPTFRNLQNGGGIIKPFTNKNSDNDDTYNVIIVNPFIYSDLGTALTQYECGNSASDAIKVVLYRSGSSEDVHSTSGAISIGADTLYFPMSKSSTYSWGSLGLSPNKYKGTYTYNLKMRIKNLYNAEFESESVTGTLNFDEKVINQEITSIQYKTSSSDSWSKGDIGSNRIQEGLYLKVNFSYDAYSADELRFYLYRDSNIVADFSENAQARATNQTPKSESKSFEIGPLGEITSTNNINWKVRIINNGGTSDTSNKTTSALRHTVPTWNFTSCSVDTTSHEASDYYLSYSFEMSDSGCNSGWSATYYLNDGTNDITSSFTPSVSSQTYSGTVQCMSSYMDWEVKSIAVKMESTAQGLLTNTKTYITNFILVYQLTPTIAYRKNYLGINTSNPQLTGVVEIHNSTGHDGIILVSNIGQVFISPSGIIDIL